MRLVRTGYGEGGAAGRRCIEGRLAANAARRGEIRRCGLGDLSEQAARAMLSGQAFGAAGKTIVVEDRVEGAEASVHAICDGTNYFLWIEGVLALSVMKVTLSYARWRGFLPAYYTGFTATCRDESRHVQGGMRYLQDAVRKDPTMISEIHDTLRTILSVSGVVSRRVYYEPLGWTDEEVRVLFFQQLRRKLNDVGIGLSPDLEDLLQKVQPVLAGG